MKRQYVIGFVVGLLAVLVNGGIANAATRTWDGGGADNNWSTAANWSSDTVPGSGDLAVFDGTSTKNSTIDASFAGTITELQMNSGYTGTTTQARSLTVNGNFTMAAAGVFDGSGIGANSFDINGNFSQTAGKVIATKAMYISGDFKPTGGTFWHDYQTVVLDGTTNAVVDVNNTLELYDLVVNKGLPNQMVQFAQSSDVVQVSSTLSMVDGVFNGAMTIEVYDGLNHSTTWDGGTGTVKVLGRARTITLGENGNFPQLLLVSNGTMVNTTGTATTTFNNLSIGAGTFNANSSIILSNTHLYLDGANARYVGGIGDEQVDQSVYVLGNSSLEAGGGRFKVGYTVTCQGTMDIRTSTFANFYGSTGTVSINSGTYSAPSTTLFAGTTWTYNNSATYNHGNGIVKFEGGNQSIVGPMTFYQFQKWITGATSYTLTLPASTTVTILNYINLAGNHWSMPSAKLLIRSSTNGTQANLDAQGSRSLSDLDVKDNNNVNATAMAAGSSSVDSGNNTNWTF